MTLAKMRTLDQTMIELKTLDPGSNISRNYVRQLAISGRIPVVHAGRRRLINFDALVEYLNGCGTTPEKPTVEIGKIRRVQP